ncbi:MAG: porin [Acinetobacter sp.]
MKTKIAAAIALTLLAGSTFAAPTFYGEVDATLDYLPENNANTADRDVVELSSNNSFIGLKGEEKLTDRLSALYQAEFTFYVDDGENGTDVFVPRNLLVGLKDEKLGTLKAGKIDTPVKQLSATVDTFNNYIENSADVNGILAGENRIDNVLVYETPAFKIGTGKLEAKALLATGEGDTIKATKGGTKVAGRGLGDSWSTSITYTDNLFVVGLGYDKAIPSRFNGKGFLNATSTENTLALNQTIEADTIRAIGRLNLDNGLSLRALFQTSDVGRPSANPTTTALANTIDDAQGWLLGAEYNLPTAKAWTVKAQYSQNTTAFKSNAVDTNDFEAKQILAGLDYAFSKQVKAYGYAGYLTLEQGVKEDKQPVLGTGLEYRF